MIRPSEIKIGNWFIYEPTKKYCTVESANNPMKMKGALDNFLCGNHDLSPIKVTNEMPTLFGFAPTGIGFLIQYDLIRNLFLRFNSRNNAELWLEEEFIGHTPFVYILQNCYFDFTNIPLVGNLYGSPTYYSI